MKILLNVFAVLFMAQCLCATVPPAPFDFALANATVYLAQGVLCAASTFPSRVWPGAAAGFEYVSTIHDEKSDTNGVVGVLDGNVWVVYRGTTSKMNWMDDGEAWQDKVAYCADCAVHHGFNKCVDNTKKAVIEAVEGILAKHPSFPIMCGGHSLGGALSNLMALELINAGFKNVNHYSIGSPRVGNDAWSTYSDTVLPRAQRITHYKDPVPHTPPTYIPLVATYQHIVTEIYEDEQHNLHACKGPEDPKCSAQWKNTELVPDNHNLYLDVDTSCPDGK